MQSCDPVTGLCSVDTSKDVEVATVHYVGDPMCSWCWGISPGLKTLEMYAAAQGVGFRVTVGGLRPGGGDPWNDQFKSFLHDEWTHIATTTGQPFGFKLLERPIFNYDTEPACRAIVVARRIFDEESAPSPSTYAFFCAVQRSFYVDGKDLSETNSYLDACDEAGLDFGKFSRAFLTDRAREITRQDFASARRWGVRSFPALVLERKGSIRPLSSGYVTGQKLIDRLKSALSLA
ncbi:TPA: protein-disulfide isomerase [Pseudomonas aeruginosa]|nr:protein-disulfide isomerase [Pseudomonas aeruginosa]HEH8432077.1 protein-disulfide isomerase [Pseudomonas aeruginosa]HEH8533628.1 protein-disulfide isomerase [Pseudomonas aeruginosa]HEH8759655.1 protein-disulfide isomerase [Pseudomonas aeruginosa]